MLLVSGEGLLHACIFCIDYYVQTVPAPITWLERSSLRYTIFDVDIVFLLHITYLIYTLTVSIEYIHLFNFLQGQGSCKLFILCYSCLYYVYITL